MVGSRLAGFAYQEKRDSSLALNVCVNPVLQEFLQLRVLSKLLYNARLVGEENKTASIEVAAGFEYGYLHRLLNKLLGYEGDTHIATLMVYSGRRRKPRLRGDYQIRPSCIYRDIEGIVRVYNKAFSHYKWFRPLSVEKALDLYASSPEAIIYVATTPRNKIVGFIYAESFRAVDGRKTLLLSALAVDPEHQRRGIGSSLLSRLLSRKARRQRVALSSFQGLEEIYSRLGFRVKRRWVVKKLPLSSLPSSDPCPGV